MMEYIKYVAMLWMILGLIGFLLYCGNKNVKPKKTKFLMLALFTHTCMGLIGLFYGYVCYSTRNNPVTVEGDGQ